jgi:NCAIR mutase (PurE)-related protein
LGFAQVDHHRSLRCGFGEVIFGEGKTSEQIIGLLRDFAGHGSNALVTRINSDTAATVLAALPDAHHDPDARVMTLLQHDPRSRAGRIVAVSAGTCDGPVLKEAVAVLHFWGWSPIVIEDAGVAAIERLLRHQDVLQDAQVIIAVAGMDGAMPAVIAGFVSAPVIAVPTSVGYGAGFSGVGPLLTMLNSCSGGVTVTNIDNGFGAACSAMRILSLLENGKENGDCAEGVRGLISLENSYITPGKQQ